MTTEISDNRPAWQTDDLDEEWPDESDITTSSHGGSRSVSLTDPVGSVRVREDNDEYKPLENTSLNNSGVVGTFLVRQDISATPMLPKAPGLKQNIMKNIFSPMALERMFEPPSPPKPPSNPYSSLKPNAPAVPSRLSQVHAASSFSHDSQAEEVTEQRNQSDEILETDLPDMAGFEGRKPSMNCQFTFAVARQTPRLSISPTGFPQAQSTPGPSRTTIASAPLTDPRLRLFQFQYDTFTRDHLSAMVDSIAVNSPSGSNTGFITPDVSSPFGLSRVSETTGANDTSHLRSAKRVKLSPVTDYYGEGDGAGAVIQRPKSVKDWVGDSKTLMEQIKKQARDFSTISTVASAQSPGQSSAASVIGRSRGDDRSQHSIEVRPTHLTVPSSSSSKDSSTAGSSKYSAHSSLALKQKAADFMDQLRKDMRGNKRVFSTDTEASRLSRSGASFVEKSFAPSDAGPPEPSDGRHQFQDTTRLFPVSPARPNRAPHAVRAKQRASPRKLLRRLSAADEVDRELAQDTSNTSFDTSLLYAQFPAPPVMVAQPASPERAVSPRPSTRTHSNPNPNPALLSAPGGLTPAYPSSSIRVRNNDDLNRFVSSSTASGTTLTVGSTGSFVKHPGPAQITRIAPEDVPVLPERVGRMVFDKVMMRWVKSTANVVQRADNGSDGYAASIEGDADSEDPFRDIESLREDESERREISGVQEQDMSEDPATVDMSRIDDMEDDEVIEDDELELTSFSFDGPSQGAIDVNQSMAVAEDDETTDSDNDDDQITQLTEMSASMSIVERHQQEDSLISDRDDLDDTVTAHPLPPVNIIPSTPGRPFDGRPLQHTASSVPTPIRSALKSASVTPVSALKDNVRDKYETPANRGHRRSVSFSDGKRDGQIRGLTRKPVDSDASGELEHEGDEQFGAASSFIPSARSKRIADMMDGLEDSMTSIDDDSPSKTTSSGRPTEELQPLSARWPSTGFSLSGNTARRVFSQSQPRHSTPVAGDEGGKPNATFLTEASFGVAHDKLVEVITDVQPFEPYWEELTSIDLSHKNVESVARLKEFLPKLHSLSLNNNQLSWLSGVPKTVRTLSIASNVLTRNTSFGHLLNLESLDISRNNIDSLTQLGCLRHLHELRADGNKITSLDGLQHMNTLVKLSLQGNSIDTADFTQCSWPHLEMVNLSQNRICGAAGLSSLSSLIVLNLDNNMISSLEADSTMPRLRILRISCNKLKVLDAASFPNLRTLYADNNYLGEITKANRLSKLENMSLRNQGGKGLTFSVRDVRDVKRLYLSGNPLTAQFLTEPCYNLIYLEIAACRLTALPPNIATLVPNLRVLNLNYNFLEDVKPLEGLRRLNKLTIIGSRLKGTKGIIRVLRGCPDVEMVDFRMNPCTLGWYLPLLVKDVPGALQPSEPGIRSGNGAQTLHPTRAPRTSGGAGSVPSDATREQELQAQQQQTREGRTRGWSSDGMAGREKQRGAGADGSWQELDAKFRRDLPDDAYVGRLAYRGLVMRACARVRMLDGVVVSRKERDKAERLLEGVGRAKG